MHKHWNTRGRSAALRCPHCVAAVLATFPRLALRGCTRRPVPLVESPPRGGWLATAGSPQTCPWQKKNTEPTRKRTSTKHYCYRFFSRRSPMSLCDHPKLGDRPGDIEHGLMCRVRTRGPGPGSLLSDMDGDVRHRDRGRHLRGRRPSTRSLPVSVMWASSPPGRRLSLGGGACTPAFWSG